MTKKVFTTTRIVVRGYHLDGFGHVNHARYVEFLEEARWSFFDEHQATVERLHTRGITHAVVRLELNYRSPANLGDRLRVTTAIEKVGRSSVIMSQQVFRIGDDQLVADARVTSAFLAKKTSEPVSVRDELLALQDSKLGQSEERST